MKYPALFPPVKSLWPEPKPTVKQSPRRPQIRFSDQQKAAIIEQYSNGQTAVAIAKRWDLHPQKIRNVLREAGIWKPTTTKRWHST